eukprot:654191-Amorphochlora_amoeboformis.AAC.1
MTRCRVTPWSHGFSSGINCSTGGEPPTESRAANMDSVVILLYMMGVVKATWKNGKSNQHRLER